MKEKRNVNSEELNYPKGYFTGIWMVLGLAVFSGVGIPLSVITENFGLIGIGPAIGISLGLAIGQSVENNYEKTGKIRPLTDKERKHRKLFIFLGIVLLIIGVLLFLLLVLLKPFYG